MYLCREHSTCINAVRAKTVTGLKCKLTLLSETQKILTRPIVKVLWQLSEVTNCACADWNFERILLRLFVISMGILRHHDWSTPIFHPRCRISRFARVFIPCCLHLRFLFSFQSEACWVRLRRMTRMQLIKVNVFVNWCWHLLQEDWKALAEKF